MILKVFFIYFIKNSSKNQSTSIGDGEDFASVFDFLSNSVLFVARFSFLSFSIFSKILFIFSAVSSSRQSGQELFLLKLHKFNPN